MKGTTILATVALGAVLATGSATVSMARGGGGHGGGSGGNHAASGHGFSTVHISERMGFSRIVRDSPAATSRAAKHEWAPDANVEWFGLYVRQL
jgi:hypothetical protein